MNKTTTILIAVAFMLLLPVMATAQTVEIDNFMPAGESYCYNIQKYNANPGDRVAVYRLELLTQAYSTNGRISGLEAGIKRVQVLIALTNFRERCYGLVSQARRAVT